MSTILIIIGLLLLVAGGVIYFVKKGKLSDRDGDLIPDVVEDTIEELAKTAKEINKKAKAGKKSKKVTKSSLRAMKKAELISTAKEEFNVDFDSSLTKTNLINKVYELYNKK